MRMMDIRDRIVKLLDQNPSKRFSVGEIAHKIGSNAKSTTAALGRLVNQGRVHRPQKGVYVSKTQRVAEKAVNEKPAKVEKSEPQPGPALSIVSIDFLVEADQANVDVRQILQCASDDPKVLDCKIRKIAPADQARLKVRFALREEE
jgi:hypothetical protein